MSAFADTLTTIVSYVLAVLAAPSESRAAIAPDAEGRRRILAVEDEEGVRDYLRALLSREGYRVTLATGHDDALARAAESPFDLLVTDVNMPDGGD